MPRPGIGWWLLSGALPGFLHQGVHLSPKDYGRHDRRSARHAVDLGDIFQMVAAPVPEAFRFQSFEYLSLLSAAQPDNQKESTLLNRR